jgi:hypothetical protein
MLSARFGNGALFVLAAGEGASGSMLPYTTGAAKLVVLCLVTRGLLVLKAAGAGGFVVAVILLA